MGTALFQRGRVSGLFLVLCSVAVTGFVCAMVYIATLPTAEERRTATLRQMEAIHNAERAQAEGIPVAEVERRQQQAQQESHQRLQQSRLLTDAIKAGDDQAMLQAIGQLRVENFLTFAGPAIKADNQRAFQALLDRSPDCAYSGAGSRSAFEAAVFHSNDQYLRALIDACELTEGPNQNSLAKLILRSKHYSRAAWLPGDAGARQQAFERAILKADADAVEQLLQTGADPNSSVRGTSALLTSIRKGSEEITLRLLESGANVYEQRQGKTKVDVFSIAMERRQWSVAQAIVTREPDYLRRAEIDPKVFFTATKLAEPEQRQQAVALLLQAGLQLPVDRSSQLLISALRGQDSALLEQLLQAGANPNQPYRMSTVLASAKEISTPVGAEIVTLLERHGAIEDYLAVMRRQRGVDEPANCRPGSAIELPLAQIEQQYASKRRAGDRKEVCMIGFVGCVDLGHAADDCMRSMPRCNASGTAGAICCDPPTKAQYFAARCSGLTVTEALRWLEAN